MAAKDSTHAAELPRAESKTLNWLMLGTLAVVHESVQRIWRQQLATEKDSLCKCKQFCRKAETLVGHDLGLGYVQVYRGKGRGHEALSLNTHATSRNLQFP